MSSKSHTLDSQLDEDQLKRLYTESKNSGGFMGPDLGEIAESLNVSEQKIRLKLKYINDYGWGETCVTKRGEVVKSNLELKVADYLYDSGENYIYEPPLGEIYSPDFILNNGVAIEIWGIEKNRDYDENRLKKERWYSKSAWGLVSIDTSNIDCLCEIFPITSRDSEHVKYSEEGQLTFWNSYQNHSLDGNVDKNSQNIPFPFEGSDDKARQLMLNGRPEKALLSDFTEEGAWWEVHPPFNVR